jgi:hypothetical protein
LWIRWIGLPAFACAAGFAPQVAISTPDRSSLGSLRGQVVDPSGNLVVGARVKLVRQGHGEPTEVATGSEGQFLFAGVSPGPFQIVIAADGFSTQELKGVLHFGEALDIPQVTLSLATATVDILVNVTNKELAEEQIKVQEKQRVLGVVPNFYVTYDHNALPLAAKQKFELAWKSILDPFTFVASGGIAGVEQATNSFKGYGQGAQGYGKRYGASIADFSIGTMIGGAILPALLKQDPRYFYKGTGTVGSRITYALGTSVVSKGDNGHWQPAYAGILGSLAAGGISNLYYPSGDRNGARLTFENTAFGIAGSAASNILQEFLIRRLTPHTHDPTSAHSVAPPNRLRNKSSVPPCTTTEKTTTK